MASLWAQEVFEVRKGPEWPRILDSGEIKIKIRIKSKIEKTFLSL